MDLCFDSVNHADEFFGQWVVLFGSRFVPTVVTEHDFVSVELGPSTMTVY